MKSNKSKRILFSVALSLVFLCVACFTSCKDDEDGKIIALTIKEGVWVSNCMQITLMDNTTLQLTPFIMPRNAKNQAVTYSNKNPNVLEVSADGIITPKLLPEDVEQAVDTLTVSATDGSGISAWYRVVINTHMIKVTAINVTAAGNNIVLMTGDSFDLAAQVSVAPADAFNKTLNYVSNASGIASVTQEGMITGVSPGETQITIVALGGNPTGDPITRAVNVTVLDLIPISSIVVAPDGQNITVRAGGLPFDLGQHVSLLPLNATFPTYKFVSADETIVTVDQDGIVTGVAAGATTIDIVATDVTEDPAKTTVNVTVTADALQIWNDFERAHWTVTTTVDYSPLPFNFVPDGWTGTAPDRYHTNGDPHLILNDLVTQYLSFIKLNQGAYGLGTDLRPEYNHQIPTQTELPGFIVDMGEQKTFNYMMWRHRQWNWTAIWFGCRIYGSNDGENWTQIRSQVHEAGETDIFWIPNPRNVYSSTSQYSLTAAENQIYRLLMDESTYQYVRIDMASYNNNYGGEHPDHPEPVSFVQNATIGVAVFGLGHMFVDE